MLDGLECKQIISVKNSATAAEKQFCLWKQLRKCKQINSVVLVKTWSKLQKQGPKQSYLNERSLAKAKRKGRRIELTSIIIQNFRRAREIKKMVDTTRGSSCFGFGLNIFLFVLLKIEGATKSNFNLFFSRLVTFATQSNRKSVNKVSRRFPLDYGIY